jgi:hypothetical protein
VLAICKNQPRLKWQTKGAGFAQSLPLGTAPWLGVRAMVCDGPNEGHGALDVMPTSRKYGLISNNSFDSIHTDELQGVLS